MARIRTIKPEFFRHGGLFDAEQETGLPLRLAFAGLWTACDKEGRFLWRPRELKLDCLPHDGIDFSRVLDALRTRGFIEKYSVEGVDYGFVPSWHRHQAVNNRETPSSLPCPSKESIESASLTREPSREPRVDDASSTRLEGKGREGKGKEHAKSDDASNMLELTNGHDVIALPALPPVATLPLVDGSEHGISKQQVAEWSAAFPAVDVPQQLASMRAWLHANPTRRKTRKGVAQFVVGWLQRSQDKGRAAAPQTMQRPARPRSDEL